MEALITGCTSGDFDKKRGDFFSFSFFFLMVFALVYYTGFLHLCWIGIFSHKVSLIVEIECY